MPMAEKIPNWRMPEIGVQINEQNPITLVHIYDDVKSQSTYIQHPISIAIITAVGLGALKVSGQIIGKSLGSNGILSDHRSGPSAIVLGTCAVATMLYLAEALREGFTNSTHLKHVAGLSLCLTTIFALSVAQSVSVKKTSNATFPYWAAGRQSVSLFTSFELNNLLTSGDSFFTSSTADLLYRTEVIASAKISGYMVGNEAVSQHCSGSPSESDPGENTPLLAASGLENV